MKPSKRDQDFQNWSMRVEIMRVKPSKYAKILWDIVLTGLPVTLNISVMNRDRDPELFLMCSMGMNWSRNSQVGR